MKSPLGQYGSLVAAILSVLIVGAAAISHLVAGVQPSPFLDSLATVVVSVVLGVQVATNGSTATASAALISSQAAHNRLDEIHAPAAGTTPVADPGAVH